jgi:hypothetical protein
VTGRDWKKPPALTPLFFTRREEKMSANIYLGASILSAEGNYAGEVLYVVGNKKTNSLTHLIMKSGVFDIRLRVVSSDSILRILYGGKKVQLNLTARQIEQLPDFAHRKVKGETGVEVAAGPLPTRFIRDALSPSPVPVMADDFGFGIETEKLNIPEDSFLIREGADPEAVGMAFFRIVKVGFNKANWQIETLKVSRGRFFALEAEVPMSLVNSASDDWLVKVLEGIDFEMEEAPDYYYARPERVWKRHYNLGEKAVS